MNKKVWIIYDGRYPHDPQGASIAEICGSMKEAKKALKETWPDDYVIVEEETEVMEENR